MKLIYENLEIDGQRVEVLFDFADANTRAEIKVLLKYPRLLECIAKQLADYEANGGMGGTPDVKVTPIAAKSAALPKIPKELLDQMVAEGPMTAEQINATTMALKKALIERALGGELSHHLGYPPGAAKPEQAGNLRKRQQRQDRAHRRRPAAHRSAA